jgi:hypothetical protein
MILSASSLTDLQSCPRKILLSTDWEILKLRPKQMLDSCLRRGILSITQGGDAAAIAEQFKLEFLQAAANPGMDTPRGAKPYEIAKDHVAMIQTILRAAKRMGLPVLRESPVVPLTSTTDYQPLAFTDGVMLHRIITVDRWDDAALSRELHSWYTIGDQAVTGLPLTLHVIETGQTRNGRRASPWARGWRHPTLRNAHRIRFLHKDGSTFKGWTPVWLADERELDAEEWVEAMWREGAVAACWKDIAVASPTMAQRSTTLGQLRLEAHHMSVLISERQSNPWSALPMHRGSCDGMVPCGWQEACYRNGTDVQQSGLYQSKMQGNLRVTM